MCEPWATDGFVCIAVDIQHSISATRKKNHKVTRYPGGGEIHFVWGDARSWKPEDFDADFFQKSIKSDLFHVSPVCTNLAGSGGAILEYEGLANAHRWLIAL
ncbi:MAG: hypothetical protein WDM78_11585 [Puia sp.]